jgi:serine/threonine-protein kinase RIO1
MQNIKELRSDIEKIKNIIRFFDAYKIKADEVRDELKRLNESIENQITWINVHTY